MEVVFAVTQSPVSEVTMAENDDRPPATETEEGQGHAPAPFQINVLQCGKCKGTFHADVPRAQMLRSVRVTALIWPHDKPAVCPHCGQAYAYMVQNVAQVMAGWVPVEKPPDTSQPTLLTGEAAQNLMQQLKLDGKDRI